MLWVIWYLSKYNSPTTPSLESWYGGKVLKSNFMEYLLFQKYYREDWRDTIIRWFYFVIKKRNTHSSNKGMARERMRRREIEDILNDCISRGYIIEKHSNDEIDERFSYVLFLNFQGRNFIKPLKFLNTALAEYGYVLSVFLGLGGAGILYYFWRGLLRFFGF